MKQIPLLKSLPKPIRDINSRSGHNRPELVAIAKQFGEHYFDGSRESGCGGYRYDGRWVSVAKDLITQYNLSPGMRVLDLGCAKGFFVKDILESLPGLEVFGLDISDYAIRHCDPTVIGRLHLGSVDNLPFPDKSFDMVIALNVMQILPQTRTIVALQEMGRVSRGKSFVQVTSYHTPEQNSKCEFWSLSAEHHHSPDGWLALFHEAGYSGDYDWTIFE